jgi:internalin A
MKPRRERHKRPSRGRRHRPLALGPSTAPRGEDLVEHPVFGPIEWDEDGEKWIGRVEVDFFLTYDMVAEAEAEELGLDAWWGPRGSGHSQGEFDLRLVGSGRSGPSTRQEKVFLDFLDHRNEICQRVADAIYDLYRASWGHFRARAKSGGEGVYYDEILIPELSDREGLKVVIRLHSVTVVDFLEDDVAVLGFGFDCTWDFEHGLGVQVRGRQVVRIGESADTWSELSGCPKDRPLERVTQDQIEAQRRIAAIKKSGGDPSSAIGEDEWPADRKDGVAAIKRLGGTIHRVSGEAGEDTVEINLLGNAGITDADLIWLRHFSGLSRLQLASTRITDGGLAVLQEFKDLRLLELSGAMITDSGLKMLHGLKNLKDLYLTGARITDAGLVELRELPSLSGLHLDGTSVTDAGMKEIGKFTGMKHLDLSGTRVTDVGIRELKELRALLSLNLQGTPVTDAALTVVEEFKSLRYLTLSHCNVTDLGLEPLKELKALRSLTLVSTATTDSGIAELQRAITGLQVVR